MANPSVTVEILGEAKGFNSAVASVTRTIEHVRAKMQTISRVSIGFLVGGGFSIYKFISAAVEAEDAVTELNAALKAQKANMAEYSKSLQDAAENLSDLTGIEDDEIKAAMAYGLRMGVAADKIEEVTKQSLALRDATKTDLLSAMQAMAKFASGDADALKRLAPELAAITDKQELAAKTSEVLQRNWEIMLDKVDTSGVKFKKLRNSIEELKEAIGTALLPLAEQLTDRIQAAAEVMEEWTKANNDSVAAMAKTAVKIAAIGALAGPAASAVSLLASSLSIAASGSRLLANRWTLAGGAIVALSAAALKASGNMEAFKRYTGPVGTAMEKIADTEVWLLRRTKEFWPVFALAAKVAVREVINDLIELDRNTAILISSVFKRATKEVTTDLQNFDIWTTNWFRHYMGKEELPYIEGPKMEPFAKWEHRVDPQLDAMKKELNDKLGTFFGGLGKGGFWDLGGWAKWFKDDFYAPLKKGLGGAWELIQKIVSAKPKAKKEDWKPKVDIDTSKIEDAQDKVDKLTKDDKVKKEVDVSVKVGFESVEEAYKRIAEAAAKREVEQPEKASLIDRGIAAVKDAFVFMADHLRTIVDRLAQLSGGTIWEKLFAGLEAFIARAEGVVTGGAKGAPAGEGLFGGGRSVVDAIVDAIFETRRNQGPEWKAWWTDPQAGFIGDLTKKLSPAEPAFPRPEAGAGWNAWWQQPGDDVELKKILQDGFTDLTRLEGQSLSQLQELTRLSTNGNTAATFG